MIRGTTPTFVLTVSGEDVDLTQARNVYASFVQGSTKMTKKGDDLEIQPKQVDVYFNQSDSLKFKVGAIMIQLNWTYADGSRACSDIVSTDVGLNLLDEVLE